MLDPLIELLNDTTPLFSPWGRIAVIPALFVLAWALSRASGFVARVVLGWHDRRHEQAGTNIVSVKRRETTVAVIRTGIAYGAFATAAVLAVGQLMGGVDQLTAIAGASFLLILAGFSIQRVLTDLIAGLTMFAERWYSVGDTIFIAGWELQGVVEDVSLRRTKLRSLDGEIIHVHNSQIPAVRVLPRGLKEMAVELFVTDRVRGEALVAAVSSILPEGPTAFVRRPWVERVDVLGEDLVRLRLRAAVAPGREWLVEGFLADLLKEQGDGGLIAHGPVAMSVDESAARSFARASGAMRWGGRRSPAPSGAPVR